MRVNRPVLYNCRYVRGFATALSRARADLRAQHAAHVLELTALRTEVDQMRAELDQLRALRAVTKARIEAEVELKDLYRQREIQRAQATERDPRNWLDLN